MILPETPFYNIPGWVHALNQGVDRIALFPATSIVYPRPAAGGAHEERVVIFHRQVVDRVPAKAAARRTRRQFLGFVLLPGEARDFQRWPRPADNARPNAHRTRLDPALPLNVQRMLRRTHQRFRLACLRVVLGRTPTLVRL